LIKLGHEVILLNARYVKSFVVGNKNGYNDAAAIFDAVTRPNKRVVSIKTIAQQDIHMAHGVRKERVDFRTALVNQTRGFLSERGIVMAKSVNQFRKRLPEILDDADNGLTPLCRELITEKYEQLKQLDNDIKAHDRRINPLCKDNDLSRRFLGIPGIGPLTATYAAADIGTGKGLGIVPRQQVAVKN
jgi:transposase